MADLPQIGEVGRGRLHAFSVLSKIQQVLGQHMECYVPVCLNLVCLERRHNLSGDVTVRCKLLVCVKSHSLKLHFKYMFNLSPLSVCCHHEFPCN